MYVGTSGSCSLEGLVLLMPALAEPPRGVAVPTGFTDSTR